MRAGEVPLVGDAEVALEVVEQCPCGDGCPSCIGPVGEDVASGAKALTRQLLLAVASRTSKVPVLEEGGNIDALAG